MKLSEIENLTAAELKDRRDDLIASAAESDPKELAERYIRARLDATTRDEKLGEQGRTITALQDGAEATRGNIATLEAELARAKQAATAAANSLATAQIEIKSLKSQVDQQTARAERLKAEALRNREAISTAASRLNDAVARQQIEDADQGA